jgi:hypothetical protein
MLYPLSYGGSAAAGLPRQRSNGTEQPYQPAPLRRATRKRGRQHAVELHTQPGVERIASRP